MKLPNELLWNPIGYKSCQRFTEEEERDFSLCIILMMFWKIQNTAFMAQAFSMSLKYEEESE